MREIDFIEHPRGPISLQFAAETEPKGPLNLSTCELCKGEGFVTEAAFDQFKARSEHEGLLTFLGASGG